MAFVSPEIKTMFSFGRGLVGCQDAVCRSLSPGHSHRVTLNSARCGHLRGDPSTGASELFSSEDAGRDRARATVSHPHVSVATPRQCHSVTVSHQCRCPASQCHSPASMRLACPLAGPSQQVLEVISTSLAAAQGHTAPHLLRVRNQCWLQTPSSPGRAPGAGALGPGSRWLSGGVRCC